MKNNDDITATDTNEIKRLINRVKQGKLDQGDAQLIEKLLNFLLTIVSLLQRKHTSIRRVRDLLFGTKEKKRGKDETKNRAEESRSGAEASSQTDSPKESPSSSTCEGDLSTQEVKRLKRPGHGRKAASELLEKAKEKRRRAGEKVLRLKAEMAFLATGGTRGDFAREWPSVFLEEVRGQRKFDAVSGN